MIQGQGKTASHLDGLHKCDWGAAAKNVGIVFTWCKKLRTMEDNSIMTFSTFDIKESHQQLVIGNCFIFS